MFNDFDVLVVGAGPAGSTAARSLAGRGWRVGLLEEHREIGESVNCSGIIGVEAFERYRLPSELVLHTLQAVEFHSPKGGRFSFDASRPLAHAVSRVTLDHLLGERAHASGAELLLEHRVVELSPYSGGVEVTAKVEGSKTRVLNSRAVVVATGAGMPLLRKLGFHRVPARLLGVQTELALTADQVEVYLGRHWAPEGFAWVVPIGGGSGKSRVAVRA